MFGSHLSIAGSMVNALHEGERLGLGTVQIFTKNQQQWKVKPLDPGVVRDWRAEVARLGWDRGGPGDARGGGGRTVAHASYLINLASVDGELRRKSVALMHDEIERCEALGIPFLVHHPGSHVGGDLESGLRRIAAAYKELLARTRGYATVSCLEGTVGAGCLIGGPFEHLAALRGMIAQEVREPDRVGYCLDTCHMHAFGYDLSDRARANAAIGEFDRVCGLGHLKVWHLNDSKGACGSRRDRHEHIGHGTIGRGRRHWGGSGFAAVVNHPAFAAVPKILETPKEDRSDGVPWDTVNLGVLRRLSAKPERSVALGKDARRADKRAFQNRGTPALPSTPSPREGASETADRSENRAARPRTLARPRQRRVRS